jgi:hypothetical protein
MQQLYEPLIGRDLAAIPGAVRRFRESHSPEELFLAVARFALLAYAPSQHAKHALLACLAVHDLREEFGERFDEAVTELAIYAAGSRQPWSEPPILEPPAIDATQPGELDELLAAIEAGDRHRAERWLAKRAGDPALAHDYFAAAADDLEDLGHKLIVAAAAWRLVPILGERGRYATLRVGVWEMTAYRGPRAEPSPGPPAAELLPALIDEAIAAGGSLEAMHAVFLMDAALSTGDDAVLRRVSGALGMRPPPSPPAVSTAHAPSPALLPRTGALVSPPVGIHAAGEDARPPQTVLPHSPPPVYRYARDYGQYLKACAVAKRLRPRFPTLPLDAFVAAAYDNLERAPSFEDWSFA